MHRSLPFALQAVVGLKFMSVAYEAWIREMLKEVSNGYIFWYVIMSKELNLVTLQFINILKYKLWRMFMSYDTAWLPVVRLTLCSFYCYTKTAHRWIFFSLKDEWCSTNVVMLCKCRTCMKRTNLFPGVRRIKCMEVFFPIST